MTHLVAISYSIDGGCYTLCRPGRPSVDLPQALNPLLHELLRGSHAIHPGHEFWSMALALLNPMEHPFPDLNPKQTYKAPPRYEVDRDVKLTADEQRRAGKNPGGGLECFAGATSLPPRT